MPGETQGPGFRKHITFALEVARLLPGDYEVIKSGNLDHRVNCFGSKFSYFLL